MALDFWTSFGYSTTVLDYFNSVNVGGVVASITATSGRTGGPSLRVVINSGFTNIAVRFIQLLLTSGATRWAPFAVRLQQLPVADRVIFEFRESNAVQVDIRVTSTGFLKVTRAGTLLGTSSAQVIFPNIWFHGEIKSLTHNSTGTIDVRAHGDSAGIPGLALINQDTQATGNALIDAVAYCAVENGVSNNASNIMDFCHLLVSPDDWSGDVRVDYLPPTGAGNYSQWTPSSGANYTTVDEIGSPNTADYNASQTVGNKDSFTHGTIPSTATPIAVCPVMLHNKQDAGAAQDNFLMRQGGVDYNPGVAFNPPFGSNQVVKEAYMQDPTATNWTPTTVNAVEFGYERTA